MIPYRFFSEKIQSNRPYRQERNHFEILHKLHQLLSFFPLMTIFSLSTHFIWRAISYFHREVVGNIKFHCLCWKTELESWVKCNCYLNDLLKEKRLLNLKFHCMPVAVSQKILKTSKLPFTVFLYSQILILGKDMWVHIYWSF